MASHVSQTNADAVPSPAPTLMTLPAEIRLQVYRYLNPHLSRPSTYAGLRTAYRQLRMEFDHEALKAIRREYKTELPELRGGAKIHPERPLCMADVTTLDLQVPLHLNSVRGYTYWINPHVFTWPWLKTLIVTFDYQKFAEIYKEQFNYMCTVMHREGTLTLNSQIDTAIFKWTNKPVRGDIGWAGHTLWGKIRERYEQLTLGPDCVWSFADESDEKRNLIQYSWRRRSKRETAMLQHLATFLLLLESWYFAFMSLLEHWYAKLKPWVRVMPAIIRSILVYSCVVFGLLFLGYYVARWLYFITANAGRWLHFIALNVDLLFYITTGRCWHTAFDGFVKP